MAVIAVVVVVSLTGNRQPGAAAHRHPRDDRCSGISSDAVADPRHHLAGTGAKPRSGGSGGLFA
ncbi:hypothetical protein DXT87_10875 [Arthrobacter sp. AET 35A]|nr:hypothetical protein [Arthrobacter sp. AET 35A]